MKRREAFFHSGFRFAAFLSLCFHLVFVTTVEATVFLGKVFNPPQVPIFLNIKAGKKALKTMSKKAQEIQKGTTISRERFSSDRVQKSDLAVDQKSFKPGSDLQKNIQSLKKSFGNFEESQAQLDKRIQKFRNDLIALTTEHQNAASVEFLVSQVSDIEKVPLGFRKSLLPVYLKTMRLKIVNQWSRIIEEDGLTLGLATVEYRIVASGTVTNLTLSSGDGSDLFRQSCLKAVVQASPFDPLPFQFHVSEQKQYLTIALTFHLRRQK